MFCGCLQYSYPLIPYLNFSFGVSQPMQLDTVNRNCFFASFQERFNTDGWTQRQDSVCFLDTRTTSQTIFHVLLDDFSQPDTGLASAQPVFAVAILH